jgi:predicted PurR-regulated permease PerM
MITALVILSILFAILIYICLNLFKKVERLEKLVDSQDQYIAGVSNAINASSAKLEEIDEKGTFHSDDEIGWFFESIKTLQRELNDFNINGRSRI